LLRTGSKAFDSRFSVTFFALAKEKKGAKLQDAALKAQRGRRKGLQELGTLLVGVLARLGIVARDDDALEST